MRWLGIAVALVLTMVSLLGGAEHASGCVPQAEPPANYLALGTHYVRNVFVPVLFNPPPWYDYEETNGVPGLQRGGVDPFGGEDPVWHHNCGHGPDRLHWAF